MNMKKTLSVLFFLWVALGAAAQVSLEFSSASRGPVIGRLHYGIFYEEINHGGDGGLYAELIRNRSFEDNAANPDCWWGLGGMSMELVSGGLLNAAQEKALKLNINEYDAGVRNEGFWGMNIVSGREYTLTFWAKTDGTYTGRMRAELQNDNFGNLGRTEFDIRLTENWQKYTVKITATANETKGWLALKGLEPMVIYLDVVSLFPPTYKNRPNGCRIDLAEMLEAMHPGFMRFPGGCYIEGTWQNDRNNRFEWKKTVGPIEERPGHMNVNWGYRVSDGFGFHELLQLAEDLGAEPLFVANIGLGHGWMQPYTRLDDYIQEALDAIEYCNGDVTTPYGAMRAANGHPEPFNLRLLEIGNENYNFISQDNGDMSDHYAERYAAFYKAIKEKYPYMTLIGNVESWATDNPSWRNGHPVEVVDEHYYRSTSWFRGQYNKYDNYSRNAYKVYAGEYAVTSDFGAWGNLNAALAEAVYMAGMERNSDVCVMTSYAPILCNEAHPYPWMPDMIRFNSSNAFGTPSYWVQQMMSADTGHRNITWTERGNTVATRNTAFGLSSWGTAVAYDNISVTDGHGRVVYATDFSDAGAYALDWNAAGGSWNIDGGTLNQTSLSLFGECNVCYNLTTENCVLELDATKKSGAEGFLIAFSYNDPQNYVWWNLGGWNNSQHAIEQCVDGVKTTLAAAGGSLVTGQTYHLKVVKSDNQVYCYVGDSLYHQVSLPDSRRVYTCAALNEAEDTLILKLVNTGATAQDVALRFKDFEHAGSVSGRVLRGAGTDENGMQNRLNVSPAPVSFTPPADDLHAMEYTAPAYSLSILRIPVQNVAAEEVPQPAEDDWEDITSLLANTDFAEGRTGWQGTEFSNAPGTVAEFFNTNFTAYQTLRNMPAGEYRLTVDGFYRYGAIENAYAAHVNGSEQQNALLYLTTDGRMKTAPLVSLYDERAPFVYSPVYTYPDNMDAANVAFNVKAAYGTNAVEAVQTAESGTLTIGLRKVSAVSRDWTCFDNVKLYYRRHTSTGIDLIPAQTESTHGRDVYYTLDGRRLDGAPSARGIYIRDGKKIVIR